MKTSIIVLLIFLGCNIKQVPTNVAVETLRIDTVTVIKKDTVFIRKNDTVVVIKQSDSLLAVIRSLNDRLFLSNYRVERTRYYLKIVQRNPKQLKFLVSWINRAVN